MEPLSSPCTMEVLSPCPASDIAGRLEDKLGSVADVLGNHQICSVVCVTELLSGND